MAMPTALSEVDGFPFVLKDNRGDEPEDQVTFQLIGLKDRERTLARNALLASGEGDNTTADALDLTVSLGLKGWSDNFKRRNKSGDLVPLEWPGNGRRAAKLLGEVIVQELGMEIMRASEIGEHEAKN